MLDHSTLSLGREAEFHYSFSTDKRPFLQLHDHDYYEITIVTVGSVLHHINDTLQTLPCNSMTFIRPHDIHFYSDVDNGAFEYINLTFSKSILNELFRFLGPGFDKELFNSLPLPPVIKLSSADTLLIRDTVNKFSIMSIDNNHKKTTFYKFLLSDLFFRYYKAPIEAQALYPAWLNDLLQKVSTPAYFCHGIESLEELSGKNISYISRVFKKHLNCTPTAYINELRLNYCANRLIHSDAPIIDIAMDSGFNNLSHFYHLFKEKFHMSPKKFRKDKPTLK